MRKLIVASFAAALVLAACGGDGGSLTAEQRTWCYDNGDLVDDVAGERGLLDFVDTWYDTEGDGIGADGEPEQTERNIEVSEDLRRRNGEDPDALIDDLYDVYLDHPDGEEACTAAYEANA
jgi:hypothetical protein